MCTFCNHLMNKIQKGNFKVLKYDLTLNKNGNITYNANPIYGYSKNSLIPMNVICAARKQFITFGINSIDTNWFQNKFKKPIAIAPCSMKFLKEIVQ